MERIWNCSVAFFVTIHLPPWFRNLFWRQQWTIQKIKRNKNTIISSPWPFLTMGFFPPFFFKWAVFLTPPKNSLMGQIRFIHLKQYTRNQFSSSGLSLLKTYHAGPHHFTPHAQHTEMTPMFSVSACRSCRSSWHVFPDHQRPVSNHYDRCLGATSEIYSIC